MLLEGMKRAVVVSVLSVGCASSSSNPPPESSPPASSPPADASEAAGGVQMPPDLVDHVKRSSVLGRELYVLDMAAATGSDALSASVPDAKSKGVAGYLPLHESAESFLVSFFTADDPPKIVYEVRVAPDKKPEVLTHAPPKEATAQLTLMVRSRQRAITALPPSEQPVNPIVLPGEATGQQGVLVYLLAGTKKPDTAVFGRHFRALVALDGKSVSNMTPLTNTNLEMPTRDPNGKPVESLVVSHVVTAYPLETHVFTSLRWGTTIYVGTDRGVFQVAGDKITFMGEKGPRPPTE